MNTKDMLLESASGFMMPFEASEEEEIQVSLGFGEQKHGRDVHSSGSGLCRSRPALVRLGDRNGGRCRYGCRP